MNTRSTGRSRLPPGEMVIALLAILAVGVFWSVACVLVVAGGLAMFAISLFSRARRRVFHFGRRGTEG